MARYLNLGIVRIRLPERKISPIDAVAMEFRRKELEAIRTGAKGTNPTAESLEAGKRLAVQRKAELERNWRGQRETL